MRVLLLLLAAVGAECAVRECSEVDLLSESPAALGTNYLSANNTLVRVVAGQDAVLPCKIAHADGKMVAWLYKNTRRLLTLQDRSFTQDPRISAQYFSLTNTWTLYIRNVTADDEGIYECQLSTDPWRKLQIRLKVNDVSQQSASEAPPVLTRDYHVPGWNIAGSQLCPDRGDDVSVVMLVQSAPAHFDIRSALRRTWARTAIERNDVVFAFMLAAVDDQSLQQRLEYESDLYGDLVQARFHDHYNNLTLKTLASLEWFEEFCPQALFLLKADDDLYVNVDNLLQFVQQHRDQRRTIYGNVVFDPRPDRNKQSRYYTSPAIWDRATYPVYTGGPLYLVSGDAVADIHRRVMQRPYFFIEDVTVTGIGAKLARVRRQRSPEFFTYSVPSDETCLFRLLVGVHQVPTADLRDIWQRVNDPDIRCPTQYSPSIWQPCVSLKQQDSLRHCVLNLFSTKKQ